MCKWHKGIPKVIWIFEELSRLVDFPLSSLDAQRCRYMLYERDNCKSETYSQDVASTKLYKRNGITNPRKDIDMAEIYEPSTWEELMHYEHYHFCDENEGWKLIEKGITAIDGEFPVNPSGGVLSTNPIGATPVIRVAEAASVSLMSGSR